jgi:hypothetical protein
MPANINPIYTNVPNVGRAAIVSGTSSVKSNGTTAGTGADLMVKLFTAGTNGSYVDRIRFISPIFRRYLLLEQRWGEQIHFC